jgi:hypothetical protein
MSLSHGGEVPSKYHAKKNSDAANLVNLDHTLNLEPSNLATISSDIKFEDNVTLGCILFRA